MWLLLLLVLYRPSTLSYCFVQLEFAQMQLFDVNQRSNSIIVLILPMHQACSLKFNFPADNERERGENKTEGKYFFIHSMLRNCCKKLIYILHVFQFIHKTDKTYSFVIEILYLYTFVKTKTHFPSKINSFFIYNCLQVCYSNSRWQPVFCFTYHHRWNHH